MRVYLYDPAKYSLIKPLALVETTILAAKMHKY